MVFQVTCLLVLETVMTRQLDAIARDCSAKNFFDFEQIAMVIGESENDDRLELIVPLRSLRRIPPSSGELKAHSRLRSEKAKKRHTLSTCR